RSPAAAPGRLPDLARVIAELATPDGKMSVLGRWPRDVLVARTGLQTASEATNLERDWLGTAAAVRPSLARFEALPPEGPHLRTQAPRRAWASHPADPWRTDAVKDNATAREGGVRPVALKTPTLVAAFGEAGVWGNALVAVGLIDEFDEHVPMVQRTTYAA